jgi:8-amino-7-oxononanoate synthase
MDGDQCPLNDLIDVADEFSAAIILDEAHSTGILGKRGGGLAVSMELETKIHVRIHTFGKAMGIHGACVACSDLLTSYLINFSRPFIYTTALPQHSIVSIDCAFDFLEKNIHLQRLLKHKIELFKKHCNIETSSSSPIQPVLISGNERVKEMSRRLLAHGLDVRPILSPTVKAGTERLRICLHTFDEDKDILALATTLNEVLNES